MVSIRMEAIRTRELKCKHLVYDYLACINDKQRKEVKEKYKAESGTRQYGDMSYNLVKPTSACYNDCKYCYVKPMFHRFKIGVGREITLNPELDESKVKKAWSARAAKKAIMFPSSHDIFPSMVADYVHVCLKMIDAGHQVVCVTKPRIACIKEICGACDAAKYKSNLMFRFTIGSANSSTLKHWEPNAPSFEERLSCLQYAFDRGFKTSISIEPMLDNQTDVLIEKLRPYVNDTIWIGLMTQVPSVDLEDICFEKSEEEKTKYLMYMLKKYRHDDMIMLKSNLVKYLWKGAPLATTCGV